MTKLVDYVGAGALLQPERGVALDARRWGWMPKVDGVYAVVTLDADGRIAYVNSRSGAPLADAADLIGVLAGAPHSTLVGELEAHTESGNAAAAARGWRNLHLFDVTRVDGRDVVGERFDVRYSFLHQMQAWIEDASRAGNSWRLDEQRDAHDVATGKYVHAVPRDIRRLPIVELARGTGAGEQLWSSYVERDRGEGLVAVRLDAPAATRGAKRKIKRTDTIDARVVAFDAKAVVLQWFGRQFVVASGGRWYRIGSIVEVKHDGFYASGEPRFARVVRKRTDLAA